MAREKKLKKLLRALRDVRDAPSDGKPTMKSDAFHPDDTRKLEDGAAVIHSVTPDMMDHAAHEAARLADAAAHGEITLAPVDDAAQAVGDEGEAAATDATEAAGTVVGDAVDAIDAVNAAATEAAEAAADATQQVAAAAHDIAVEAVSTADRTAEAATAGATDALGDYSAKVLEMVRTNVAATGALFAALVQAKSVPEALAVNADHMRRQFDTLTSQGRELAVLAQRLTFDALKPLDGVVRRDR